MSFEDEKLEEAMKVLQETEKLSDTDAGVLKSIKNRFKSKKKREVNYLIFSHLLIMILFANYRQLSLNKKVYCFVPNN